MILVLIVHTGMKYCTYVPLNTKFYDYNLVPGIAIPATGTAKVPGVGSRQTDGKLV